jgi:hypothetical protein
VGKPEGNRPLKIPRRRWDNNIKVDLKEEYARKWTGLIWLRIAKSGGPLLQKIFGIQKNLGNF